MGEREKATYPGHDSSSQSGGVGVSGKVAEQSGVHNSSSHVCACVYMCVSLMCVCMCMCICVCMCMLVYV